MHKLIKSIGIALLCGGVALAGGLEEGDREMSLRFSYSDVDLGSSQGFDLGSNEDTELAFTFGWLVTDRHEFGLLVGYVEQSIDGGTIAPEVTSETDGTQLGGFYNFNIPAGEMLTPYLGVSFATLGGDLGDAYDFSYSAEAGLKIYPFEHGGFSVGLSYSELRADAQDLPDADGLSLGAGLLIKF